MQLGYHRIADELGSNWLEALAADGIAAIEAYLAKYAAFHAFLDANA